MRGGVLGWAGIMPGVSDDLWWAMPVLAGRLIRLEPLALEHAPGYLAAAGPRGAPRAPGGPRGRPRPATSATPWRPGPAVPGSPTPRSTRPPANSRAPP